MFVARCWAEQPKDWWTSSEKTSLMAHHGWMLVTHCLNVSGVCDPTDVDITRFEKLRRRPLVSYIESIMLFERYLWPPYHIKSISSRSKNILGQTFASMYWSTETSCTGKPLIDKKPSFERSGVDVKLLDHVTETSSYKMSQATSSPQI